MADEFINVEITTDAPTLAQRALDQLTLDWPDFEPSPGDPEVLQIERLAPMAADAAETAARVPASVFRAILENLHGVSYSLGAPATALATFTFVDSDPHVIPAGSEIDVDGVAFTVDDDVAATGSVSGVPVTASEVGVFANDLAGDTVTPITALAFVSDVTLDGATSGGEDPEDDIEYQDRGSRELELQGRTLVTRRDYELVTLSNPSVGHVVVITDAVNREIVVTAATDQGTPLSADVKADLLAGYEEFRLSNWVITMADPTVTTIDVTYSVHPYAGYDATDLIDRINQELETFLYSGNWGRPTGQPETRTWTLEPRVRVNKLIDVIASVLGVDFVIDVDLNGSAGTLESNGDWTMPGTVPLSTPGDLNGSVA